MTAVTWDHVGKHTATPVSADFAGTFRLLRLYARRDRVVLPLWVLALGLSVGPVYVGSVNDLYSTQQQLDTYAHSIASSPGLIAMYGPMLGTSLGAVSLWKAGFQFTIIAIAAVLTVIRHTRVEEETGRAELVGATRIGRFASLTAALLLTGLGSVLVGLLSFASIASQPVPAAGAAAFGAAMAASGLLWAGVGAVAAQVASTARIARQLALGVLGIAFVLRAVGDVGSGTLSWLSPLGWCQQIRPFAQERWWVLAPLVVAATAATAAAYVLLRGRDVGAGLIADRAGPANASAT
ncbi:MAG: ABC transporter permease, partial [Mycobacteriaceae bacterium]|nr:ABC transporter permease [Mycobacteriaceae bacterium]